jgi:hypothetical protein
VTVEEDLAKAQERLELAGKMAGKLLLIHRDEVTVTLIHELISWQGLALNSIRFARRQL